MIGGSTADSIIQAYFISWYFDQLFTLIICVSIGMVLSARVGSTLFPPVPMSLVDWRTGGLSKPTAGVLASPDSATGAPENFRGEAIEKEAESFATTIAGIAVSVWTAQDQDTKPSNQDATTPPASSLPRPHDPTTLMGIAMDKAAGVQDSSSDKTKLPMQGALWSVVLPWLRLLYTISDTWERLAKYLPYIMFLSHADIFNSALHPTPPFPQLKHRLRLAAFLALLPVGPTLISLPIVVRVMAFCVGIGLFARPPLRWAVNWLDQKSPGWSRTLSVENHLLRGMPTNAQLAVTLLRNSEDFHSPLPSTGYTKETPPNEPVHLSPSAIADTWDAPLGATQNDLAKAAAPDQDILEGASGPSSEIKETEAHRPHRLLGIIKSSMKSTVKMAMKADQIRAKAGRQSAKNRIGIVPRKRGLHTGEQGPWSFRARNGGKDGQLDISFDGTISFNSDWTLQASDIIELKKHDGLGLKAKVAVGWAMEADVKDGLEIKDRFGKAYILTALSQRDQAFRRLCAIGNQIWDVL